MPRLTMTADISVKDFMDNLAREHGITRDEVFARAVVGMQLIRAARSRGLPHVGFVSNPQKLDAELRGLLPERPHIVMRCSSASPAAPVPPS